MSKQQDDATRVAGLTSILKSGNKQKEVPPSPALGHEAEVSESPSPAPARSKRDRVGKYRDPKFHHYGVYLRKDTHKRVKRRLEDMETGQDLSELVQMLLDQWLASK
jgi:hypothetical protein